MGGDNGGKRRNKYKGHMDKTKQGVSGKGSGDAWVGGDFGGLNADNCTLTTIKKRKLKVKYLFFYVL